MARHETDLVTVASALHAYEMYIRKAYLEEHGVRVFLRDEHMTSTYGYASSALGGVRLDVMARDEHHARTLLTDYEAQMQASEQRGELSVQPDMEMHRLEEVPPEEMIEWEVKGSREECPSCGAHACVPEPLTAFQLIGALLLLGVPLLFMKSTMRCEACSHRWQL